MHKQHDEKNSAASVYSPESLLAYQVMWIDALLR